MPPSSRRPWSAPSWVAYLVIFGVYLTARGYHSRDGDQAYRLPLLLHRQEPALFADDPFVRAFDAFNPHRGYLTLLDWASRPLGLSAALAGLFALTFAVTCLGLDRLARTAWPAAGRSIGWVAVGLVLVAKAGNIGTNHLFEAMLLDRLIGFGLGWVALALVVDRPARGLAPSAALIGLVALVHPAVGLQLALLIGAAWVAWGLLPAATGVGLGRALWAAAALGLALVPALGLFGGGGERLFRGLSPDDFRLLSAYVQSPQHMLPHLWRMPQWLAWGCYPVLALLTLGHAGRPWPAARIRLALVLGVNLLGLGLAWVAVEIVQDPRVTAFQPFRMATIARGLALVLLAGRIQGLWQGGDWLGRGRATLLATGLMGDWTMVVATAVEVVIAGVETGRKFARRPEAVSRLRPGGAGWCSLGRKPQEVGIRNNDPEPRRGDVGLAPLRAGLQDIAPPGHKRSSWRVSSWGLRPRLHHPAPPGRRSSHRLAWLVSLGVLGGGLLFLVRHDTESGHVRLLWALGLLAVWMVATRGRPFAWTPRRVGLALIGAWAIPLAALVAPFVPGLDSGTGRRVAEALIGRCRFGEVPVDDVERLALWCRGHTPAAARFVGPPGPKTFRLWSRRSLMFNRAGSPYHAEALADWAGRFRDHVGYRGSTVEFARAYLDDRQGLERRYQAMTDAQRAALARRQGATHVLAAPPPAGKTPGPADPLELLHVEGRYAVFRVARGRGTGDRGQGR
jgi:hypothetical protein